MPASLKRFYKEVSLAERPGGFAILLDGRDVKTPGRAPLLIPHRKLAETIAEEWRAQEGAIRIEAMPVTKFAYTAIDRVAPNRPAVIEQILSFGKTDLVCYRAPGPADLAERQAQTWDPLLGWARGRFGAHLVTAVGVGYVEQPESARLAFEQAIAEGDDFRLTGLHAGAALLGSLVLALALEEGVLDADSALAAAGLDEIYQSEKWGLDAEAAARVAHHGRAFRDVARFLALLRP